MSLMTTENTFTTEIIELIHNTKQRMAVAVNAELTMLYWHIGNRINQHILQGERAEYSEEVIRMLSERLTEQFGKGWSKRNLNYMTQFTTTFPEFQIMQLCNH
ncbi:DUF1016 N-terminal domain-containing protein [Aggregatibacter actinomycetemcomitans]|uniref:DUF1016 N-terminal domain-containing protein n=1 Tax=Aggregatibacter actinomycetemcomitans TaxID=714 RepID=UPI00022ADCAD|nr:DUF1016 N-terminal domain-containing protein [Aggregatibacter actinomycetemcomitans]KOE64947.1 hypothetical protein SCC393_0308720 [Aggregatibacter actinomycetemcomitans serotype e str. SCC393]KOE66813.1 hypothetical protein A160_0203305 [Aggregatibacter actinomycetemcomitans serotype e str. A160]